MDLITRSHRRICEVAYTHEEFQATWAWWLEIICVGIAQLSERKIPHRKSFLGIRKVLKRKWLLMSTYFRSIISANISQQSLQKVPEGMHVDKVILLLPLMPINWKLTKNIIPLCGYVRLVLCVACAYAAFSWYQIAFFCIRHEQLLVLKRGIHWWDRWLIRKTAMAEHCRLMMSNIQLLPLKITAYWSTRIRRTKTLPPNKLSLKVTLWSIFKVSLILLSLSLLFCFCLLVLKVG